MSIEQIYKQPSLSCVTISYCFVNDGLGNRLKIPRGTHDRDRYLREIKSKERRSEPKLDDRIRTYQVAVAAAPSQRSGLSEPAHLLAARETVASGAERGVRK